jgi:hypothetical protein
MKLANRYIVVVTALLLAGAVVCHGRVFMRWTSASRSTEAIETLGCKIVYEAAITVNGGEGQITVFGFDKAIGETVVELAKTFGIAKYKFSGGTMAMLSAESDDRVIKLIAVDIGGDNRTLLFKIEQSASDAKLSGAGPTEHLMKAVPFYPDSAPLFYAKNNDTGMSLEISSARVAETSVREFYDSSLSGAGWTSAMPGMNSGLAVFHKGSEICCVLVAADDDAPGSSKITVLHKPLTRISDKF